MKMNWKRTVLGGVAFLPLLAAVAGCSGNNGNGNGGSQASSGASGSAGGGASASAGGSASASGQEKAELSILANLNPADMRPADKAIMDQMEKDLNVSVKWIVPPSTGYKEQLQLTLTSGDYPDLIFFPSETDPTFLNAVNDGVIAPINSYLDQLPNVKQYTYDVSWKALETKRDGNIYAVPRTSVARNDGFEIRGDWLKNIGFQMPANHEVTIDQFLDILRKFTNDDPDKNGKKDTYGFAAFLNDTKMIDLILTNQFGDLGWQEAASGPYKYIAPMYDQNSDVYKKELAFTQQVFKEGLVDPDSAVIDRTTSIAHHNAGKTGVRVEFAGNIGNADELKKSDPNAERDYIWIQNEQGSLKGTAYGSATFGVWGVSAKSKHPDRALQVLDWLLSDKGWELVKYGVEGVEYTMKDGNREYVAPEERGAWRKSIVRRANDGDFFIDAALPNDIRERLKPLVDHAIETVGFSLDQGYIPPAAQDPDFMDYKQTWDVTLTKIIVGDLPVDEFDKLLAGWYDHGGKKYVEQMNEYIASIQSK